MYTQVPPLLPPLFCLFGTVAVAVGIGIDIANAYMPICRLYFVFVEDGYECCCCC